MMTFSEVVTSEEQLRAVLGHPAARAVNKEIARLDAHCRATLAGFKVWTDEVAG